MTMVISIDRRTLVTVLSSAGMLTIVGCGQAKNAEKSESDVQARPDGHSAAMTVYRDPSCGCCEAWAELARQAGYQVALIDRPDMPAIKAELGIPEALASCHTAAVGGYAIEGHVPLEDVARLLKDRPKGIRGIAVPGMPRGSPGMEMPDGSKDSFQVMAFDATGRTTVFKV
jgi:hypothetical protein